MIQWSDVESLDEKCNVPIVFGKVAFGMLQSNAPAEDRITPGLQRRLELGEEEPLNHYGCRQSALSDARVQIMKRTYVQSRSTLKPSSDIATNL